MFIRAVEYKADGNLSRLVLCTTFRLEILLSIDISDEDATMCVCVFAVTVAYVT